MSASLYDQWTLYEGRCVKAVAPFGTIEGILVGVMFPGKVVRSIDRQEPPWALMTDSGKMEYIDPDNSAIRIYVDGQPILLTGPLPATSAHGSTERNEGAIARAVALTNDPAELWCELPPNVLRFRSWRKP